MAAQEGNPGCWLCRLSPQPPPGPRPPLSLGEGAGLREPCASTHVLLVPLCPTAGTQLPRAWCHSGRTWPNSKSKTQVLDPGFVQSPGKNSNWVAPSGSGGSPTAPPFLQARPSGPGPPLGLQLGPLRLPPGAASVCSQGGDVWEGLLQGPHWVHGSQSLRTHLPLLPGTISFLFVK